MIVVPASIIRSRIARVGIPPVPAPRMMRKALYWARLSPDGSTTRASARLTTDAVRKSAMVASCPRERNGRRWRISDWMRERLGIDDRCQEYCCHDN